MPSAESSRAVSPAYARPLFIVNAAVAWCGVLISMTLNLSGYYVNMGDPAKPTLLGNIPDGISSVPERLFDWVTYFTILSNIVVAVVMTALAKNPGMFVREGRSGAVWRALRLDSLVMIAITGVVYNLLLATGTKTGIDAVSNSFIHVLTPLVTLLVWLVAGPRGLINTRTIALSLVLPIAWVVFALVRGATVSAYPYPFLDVITNGMGSVLAFVGQILVVAVVLASLLLGIDRLVLRAFHRAPVAVPEES